MYIFKNLWFDWNMALENYKNEWINKINKIRKHGSICNDANGNTYNCINVSG